MNFQFDDTIAAPATVPGTGAISLIRVSGKDTFGILDKCFRFRNPNALSSGGYTIHSALIYDEQDNLVDEVLVNLFRAPHSYTGEDSAEITCHASRYIVEQILRLLVKAGARLAGPGEFTRRAFSSGKMDLAQAEAVADLISSSSAVAHRVAINQMRGAFSGKLQSLRSSLLDMASLLELELDFSDEDVEFADREKLRSLLEDILGHIDTLASSFKYGNAIRNGIPVAIAGAVNSGKSTLLNALLGDDRAIVSDIGGTTRDTIEETMTIEGLLFRFIDTAGLRETSDTVENMGIGKTLKKLSEASVVLLVVDSTIPDEGIMEQISNVAQKIDFSWQKVLILLNKSDSLVYNKNVITRNKFVLFADLEIDAISISAKYGDGLTELKKWLAASQKHLESASEDTIVTNLRHYEALNSARTSLLRVRAGLESGAYSEMVSRDLRDSLDSLASITGEVTSQDILNDIFSRHCIGK